MFRYGEDIRIEDVFLYLYEAKPENRKLDLRLSESGTFKELSEYADKFEDLEAMDEKFAHVPWAVLVLVAKKRFKNSNKT